MAPAAPLELNAVDEEAVPPLPPKLAPLPEGVADALLLARDFLVPNAVPEAEARALAVPNREAIGEADCEGEPLRLPLELLEGAFDGSLEGLELGSAGVSVPAVLGVGVLSALKMPLVDGEGRGVLDALPLGEADAALEGLAVAVAAPLKDALPVPRPPLGVAKPGVAETDSVMPPESEGAIVGDGCTGEGVTCGEAVRSPPLPEPRREAVAHEDGELTGLLVGEAGAL